MATATELKRLTGKNPVVRELLQGRAVEVAPSLTYARVQGAEGKTCAYVVPGKGHVRMLVPKAPLPKRLASLTEPSSDSRDRVRVTEENVERARELLDWYEAQR